MREEEVPITFQSLLQHDFQNIIELFDIVLRKTKRNSVKISKFKVPQSSIDLKTF